LGSSFFFGAYFLGYYFFFSWTAGFESPLAAGAGPDPLPTFERPLAISLLISFPFKDSTSLVRSASFTLVLADPKTFLMSAAAIFIIQFNTDVLFA
jgi:hypothetical protein